MDLTGKRKALISVLLALGLSAGPGACSNHPDRDTDAGTAEQVAADHSGGPLDVLREAYAPYMPAGDPLAFAMKVRAVAADRMGLWRGGKDLFFRWCKGRTGHWLGDAGAYVTQQGDQHLGNVGTYLAEGKFGTLAFGMVDFDDSHRLPFQFELLQGLISLRLAAEEADVELTDSRLTRLVETVIGEYAGAARATAGGATATELLSKDPAVAKLLAAGGKRKYAKELDQYTESAGRLIGARATRRGEVKDILRPLSAARAAELGDGIAQAVARSPEAAKLFRLRTRDDFRGAVDDAALRTRVGSAGSQGLRKYFVLLDHPLADADHDVIVYLKQQIPSAAERAGLVPRDERDPGQRCAEDVAALSRPRPFFNGWCRIGRESYWVTLREPWTEELSPQDVEDFDDLLRAARVWAVAAGASHFAPGQADAIAARCDAKLAEDLRRLSGEFLKQLDADYKRLKSDPRVHDLVRQADRAIEQSRARTEGSAAHKRHPR
jgi:uncharacterized protein (DUF2252 family)